MGNYCVSHHTTTLDENIFFPILLFHDWHIRFFKKNNNLIPPPGLKQLIKKLNYITTRWTRADALKINELDSTTTQPVISAKFPVMSSENFIWGTMPLKDLKGNVVSVNGW